MKLLSAADVAIALAIRNGTLVCQPCEGRFGPYVAICDDAGLIECHETGKDAMKRVATIKARMHQAEQLA
jgi:hypothetical protein